MEWQAGYISGALLMPITYLGRIVRDAQIKFGIYGVCHAGSAKGRALIELVSRSFAVSRVAARVRLEQLGYLTKGTDDPTPLHRF